METEPGPVHIGDLMERELEKSRTEAPTRQSRRETEEQAEKDRLRGAHYDGYAKGGYPMRHRQALGALKPDGWFLVMPDASSAKKREAAWEALKRKGGTLLLLGDRGVGKTQLAVELAARLAAERLVDRGTSHFFPFEHLYASLGGLFGDEKASWRDPNNQRSPLREARDPGVLVLDEIQERSDSAWEDSQFAILFDARYMDMKRTILVANLTPEGSKEKIPASVWSRIVETGLMVNCDWPSQRHPPR